VVADPPAGAGTAGAAPAGAGVWLVVPAGLLAPWVPRVLSPTFSAAVSRIDFGCDAPAACVPMYVSNTLLSMKIATKMAVARDNAVDAPRAPKTVPEAPAPKPAPASAPLPFCSSTRPIMAKHENTCTMVKITLSIGLRPIFPGSRNDPVNPAALRAGKRTPFQKPARLPGRGQDGQKFVRLE
jgi:hypothetical protein